MKNKYLEGIVDGTMAIVSNKRRDEMFRKSLDYQKTDKSSSRNYNLGTWTPIGILGTSAIAFSMTISYTAF